MDDRPSPETLVLMRKIAEGLAAQAEEAADKWRDVSGDIALRMFAEAIRRTNRNTFDN